MFKLVLDVVKEVLPNVCVPLVLVKVNGFGPYVVIGPDAYNGLFGFHSLKNLDSAYYHYLLFYYLKLFFHLYR